MRFPYVNNFCNHIKLYLMKREFPFKVCLSFPLLVDEFSGAIVEVVAFAIFQLVRFILKLTQIS